MKNEEYTNIFRGKKITLMGLGLLGRGIGDAKFLAECGADLTTTDLKSEEELTPSIQKFADFSNISYSLGGHRIEDFRERDFILKSAGVPLDSPFIAEARKNKIPIEMSSSLFAKLAPEGAVIIGITGTRGKSTVSHLIFEILKLAGRRAYLAGNIRDIATLPLLDEARDGDFFVLELDSWQLQGFGESKISPHISVFATFMPDHMNYYKGDMREYFDDKAQIFLHQTSSDYLIAGEDVCKLLKEKAKSKLICAKKEDVPKEWKIQIPGEHNRLNIACALAVARVLKIPDDVSRTAIENFRGIPGRLELVREIRGIKIYNDTNSTTPEATIAGLRALSSGKNVVLIMGGSDKGLNMTKLLAEIDKHCKSVILLRGSGSDKLQATSYPILAEPNRALGRLQAKMFSAQSLREGIEIAFNLPIGGDIILFSPAFASFGMFKNEYDRGDQFRELVNSLSV